MIEEIRILIRSVVIWLIAILITFILGLISSLTLPFGNHHIVHRITILWGRTMIFLSGVRFEIEGIERLLRERTVIVVSNHQSLFDIISFYSFLDMQFRWLAKASLFRIPVFGWAMRAAGCVPVERDNKRLALKSLYAAAKRVRAGTSVVIFPEGTRGGEDGSMLPFRPGGFLLAKKAGVALQPITIDGANKIIPLRRDRIIQRIYPGIVRVIIHDPVLPEEYADLKTEELIQRVRETIHAGLNRLRKGSSVP
jgi:1-acyl-sn-glycerol-3-phosphate acyltransferase